MRVDSALDADGAIGCGDDTFETGKHGVTGVVHDAPTRVSNAVSHEIEAHRQLPVGAYLVRLRQPAVPRHVRIEDRRKLPRDLLFCHAPLRHRRRVRGELSLAEYRILIQCGGRCDWGVRVGRRRSREKAWFFSKRRWVPDCPVNGAPVRPSHTQPHAISRTSFVGDPFRDGALMIPVIRWMSLRLYDLSNPLQHGNQSDH